MAISPDTEDITSLTEERLVLYAYNDVLGIDTFKPEAVATEELEDLTDPPDIDTPPTLPPPPKERNSALEVVCNLWL